MVFLQRVMELVMKFIGSYDKDDKIEETGRC